MAAFNAPSLRFVGVDDGAMVIDLDNVDGFKLTWLHMPACCSRIGFNTSVVSAIAIHGNCKISSEYLNNTNNLSVVRFDKDAREDGIYSNSNAKTILPAELSDCSLIDIQFASDTIKAEHLGIQGSVKAIHLPQDIKNISDNAFKGWGLESIAIPETVKKIGSNVFMDCKKLKCVVFKGLPKKFGCDLFDGCNSLKKIEIGGEELNITEFISKYEKRVTKIESPVVVSKEIFEEDKAFDEEFIAESIKEDVAEDSLKGISVSFADGLNVILPEDYICSVDADLIGENRALVAVLNDENADLSNPYGSTESVTILYGKNIDSIREADSTAVAIGITGGKNVTDNDELNIRYELKECGEDLTIYHALICTEKRSFPVQFFFNHSGTNKYKLIEKILASVSCAKKQSGECFAHHSARCVHFNKT